VDETDAVVERLGRELARAAALRANVARTPKLEAYRQRLRAWQAVRLARTHADLLASPRMGLAAAFFLTDLYGTQDLTRRDASVRRIVPMMKRLLPLGALESVAEAIELEVLSEDLDIAMAAMLGERTDALAAADYAAAYCKVGRRADRERQIELIDDLGKSLDRLVHQPLIGSALSMMRVPAQIAGLSELHDFLQRGYQAFKKMGDAAEFLERIVGREQRLLEALFAGDDRLLGAT
jgi:hypothetical protein